MPDLTNLAEFLKYLATPVVGGIVTSFLLSRWTQYQTFDTFWKRTWSVGLAFLVGAALHALNVYFPGDWIVKLAPFFTAGMTVVLTVLSTQASKSLGITGNTGDTKFTQDF